MKKLFLLSLLITVFTLTASADIRLPDKVRPTPTQTSESNKRTISRSMRIHVQRNIKEPTLKIPRSALKDLRAQLDEIDGGTSNQAVGFYASPTQTLMSGLFFSAALIFGGVWMFRGKSFGTNQKIVSGLMIFVFLGASVMTIFANVAPRPIQGINSSLFSDKMKNSWSGAVGNVRIEIEDKEFRNAPIEFYVPRFEEDGKTAEEE